jgi:hypothetical protein
VTTDEELPTPDTDPEFWERPDGEPPFMREGSYPAAIVVKWIDGPLTYIGPVAKNNETGTIYYYIRGEWTTTAPEEDEIL